MCWTKVHIDTISGDGYIPLLVVFIITRVRTELGVRPDDKVMCSRILFKPIGEFIARGVLWPCGREILVER